MQQNSNGSRLLDQAHQAQIFDAQFNPENDHEFSLHANARWPELLRFINLSADTLQQNKIDSLEIINHPSMQSVELSLKLLSVSPIANHLSVAEKIENIPMKESKWIGILHQEEQRVAFLQLPDKTMVALTIGEGFKKSAWRILAIGQNDITLQDNNTNENVIRTIL